MFVYSCSIKIHALGFNELLESIFCILLVVEVFALQKGVEMLEEVVVGWQEIRWMWWMRHNSVAQFVQLLKCWLCDLHRALSWRRIRPFMLTDASCSCCSFLCISLIWACFIWNGFARIQKAVVDHTSRPPDSENDLFWCKFGFEKCSGAFSQSSHWAVVTGCIKCTFCPMSQSNREIVHCFIKQSRHFKLIFFDLPSAHKAPT